MRNRLWLGAIGLVIYCGLILSLSSIPADDIPPGFLSLPDKLVHCLIYLGLGLIFTYFLTGLKLNLTRFAVVVATFFATAVYGLADEFYQTLIPGRSFDVMDISADVIGGIAGCLLFRFSVKNKSSEL